MIDVQLKLDSIYVKVPGINKYSISDYFNMNPGRRKTEKEGGMERKIAFCI